MNPLLRQQLEKSIEPYEIIGEIEEFPYIEKDGQVHLFKKEFRALVAIAPRGPLVLYEWVGEYKTL
jgi:hypothetical protein